MSQTSQTLSSQTSQTLLTQLNGLEEETRLARERFQRTLDDIAASEDGGLAMEVARGTPSGDGETGRMAPTPTDADVDRLLRRLDKLERPQSLSALPSSASNVASADNRLSNTPSSPSSPTELLARGEPAQAQSHLDDLSRAQARLDSLTLNKTGGKWSAAAAESIDTDRRAAAHPLEWMESLVGRSGDKVSSGNATLHPGDSSTNHLNELEHTIDHEHAELANERDWLRREIEREQQRMEALRATHDAQQARLHLPADPGAHVSPLPLEESSFSQADMNATDFLDRWRQRKDIEPEEAQPAYLQPPSPGENPSEDRTTDVLRKAEEAMKRAERAMVSFTHHGGKGGDDPSENDQVIGATGNVTTVIHPELAGGATGAVSIVVDGETLHADNLAGRYEEVSSMARQVTERAQKIAASEKSGDGQSRGNEKSKKKRKGRRKGKAKRKKRRHRGRRRQSSESDRYSESSSEFSSSSSGTESSDYTSSSGRSASDDDWTDSKTNNEVQRSTRSLFGPQISGKGDGKARATKDGTRHRRHRSRHRHGRRRPRHRHRHRSRSDDSRSKRASRRRRRKKKRDQKRGERSLSRGGNTSRRQQPPQANVAEASSSIQDFRTLEHFLATARSEDRTATAPVRASAVASAIIHDKKDSSDTQADESSKSKAFGQSMFTRIIMSKYKSQAVAIERQREKAQAAKRSKDLQSLRKRASEKARTRRRRKEACLRVQMWWRCVSARKQLARRKERRRRAEIETARRRVQIFQNGGGTSSRYYGQLPTQIPLDARGGRVTREQYYQAGVGNTSSAGSSVTNYQRVFSPEQVLQAFGAGAPHQQKQYPQALPSARVLEYPSTTDRMLQPHGSGAGVAPHTQQPPYQHAQPRQPPRHADQPTFQKVSPPPAPHPSGASNNSGPLPVQVTVETPQLSPPPAPTLSLPPKTSPGSGRKTRRQLSILRLGALVLGFRVRLFMKSPKVQTIIRQIRDTAFVVKDMPLDALRDKTVSQLVSLKKQLSLLFHPKDGRPFGVVFAEEMNRVNRARMARLNSKSGSASSSSADSSSSSSSSAGDGGAKGTAAAAAKKNEANLKRGAAARERTKAYQKRLKEERQKKMARKNRKKAIGAGSVSTSSSVGGNSGKTASQTVSSTESTADVGGSSTSSSKPAEAAKQDGSDEWWFNEGGLGLAPVEKASDASCIVVQIMAARELYGVPRAPEPPGMRDPFASLEMTYEDVGRGITKTIHSKGVNKTMVRSSTLDPTWHTDIALALPSTSSLPEAERALLLERLFLMLRVEDNDRFNNQKLLGCLRLPLADLPGGASVGAAWYPLKRGKDVGKLCVRGDVQIRVKLVESTGGDSRISRAKRIVATKPATAARGALSPPGPPSLSPRDKVNPAARQQRKVRAGPTQEPGTKMKTKTKKKKKKKRVISYKADYSHVKSKTDCYNEMAYPVADEVNYARERQHPRHVNEEDDFSASYHQQPVIGESSFPVSTYIDLSMDDSGGRSARSSRGGGGGGRQQRQQKRPPVQESSPPLDASTLMKMYYHGESTLSALPAGRLQLDDLERLQLQLESRDRSGQSSREDPTSILPRLSAQRDMDQASYYAQVEQLEREYSRLGGAEV